MVTVKKISFYFIMPFKVLLFFCGASIKTLINDTRKFFKSRDCFQGRTEEVATRDFCSIVLILSLFVLYFIEPLEAEKIVLSFLASLIVFFFYTLVVSYYKKLTGFVEDKK